MDQLNEDLAIYTKKPSSTYSLDRDSGYGNSVNNNLNELLEEDKETAECNELSQQIKSCNLLETNPSSISEQTLLKKLFEHSDDDGDTYLMVLLAQGQIQLVGELVDHCPDAKCLEKRNNSDQSLLHIAVCINCPVVAIKLMKRGVNFELPDSSGRNIFHICADEGYVNSFKEYLMLGKELDQIPKMFLMLNDRTYRGFTPFYMAVSKQKIEMCTYLASLDGVVDVNKPDITSGNTPLMEAVISYVDKPANLSFIQLLIQTCGSNVNSCNAQGLTPMHLVAAKDDVQLFSLLLHEQADLQVTDMQGKTPLDYTGTKIRTILTNATHQYNSGQK